MNRTDLVGRVTADVELKQNKNGKNYCRFTLAVDRDFKVEEGQQDADFISCVAWGKTAEVMSKYVKKGNRVGVCGRIQTGSYVRENTNETVWTTDVIINHLEFLEPKKDNRPEPVDLTPSEVEKPADDYLDINSDELPF